MSTFPSVISTISDPLATNKLNSPSHSSIESAQNDAIKKLETFVGTLASTAGTLVYDIRATASDGGGHIQVANKGGTGQTAFTKGDILIAQSASVLTKLAVGGDNSALVADSTQATGVKWGGSAPGRISSSRDMTAASGDQIIAHGLGYTPTKVSVSWLWKGSSFGFGAWQSGSNRSIIMDSSSVAGANSTYTIYITDVAGSDQKGSIAVDGTNITISWLKAGTPTGTAYFIIDAI